LIRKNVFSGLLFLTSCLVLQTLVNGPVANAQPGDAQKVVVVQLRALGDAASVGGTVVPFEEITFTAQVPGRVEKIAGKEGDHFKEGYVLVELSTASLMAKRQAAVAQIQNANAAMRNAGFQVHRERESPTSSGMMDQVFPGNPMSGMFGGEQREWNERSTLRSRETQLQQARGSLAQAQAQLRQIDSSIRDAKTVAPFDGVITAKMVNRGDTLNPGQPLLTYANMSRLQIQIDVPARLAEGLYPGVPVSVRLDDSRKTVVQATVGRVFPMADATRHTVRVKLDLPPGTPAKAGMYAEVNVSQQGSSGQMVPTIPLSAVVRKGGLPMVYVVREDGSRRLNLLRLGEQLDADNVVVLTGLRGGERILANP
jgi:multidrug efflux pump subunit AcrA (membrane-fusion protein)